MKKALKPGFYFNTHFYVLLFGVFFLKAQEFDTIDWNLKESYFPFTDISNITLNVPISFVVIQDSVKTRGLPNNNQTVSNIERSVFLMNRYYAKNAKPIDHIEGRRFVKDTKIRMRLTHIRFLNRPDLFENKSMITLYKSAVERFPELNGQIVVFLNEFDYPGALGWASHLGRMPSGSHAFTVQTKLVDNLYFTGYEEEYAQHWVHEINHLFGLNHIYDRSIGTESCNPNLPDYLADVFGNQKQVWCENPPAACDCCYYTKPFNEYTNNIMSGNNIKSPSKAAYFSPMQIARMHRALALTALGELVIKTSGRTKIQIRDSVYWKSGKILVHQNIKLKKNAVLYIQGQFWLKEGIKLTLSKNSIIFFYDEASAERLKNSKFLKMRNGAQILVIR